MGLSIREKSVGQRLIIISLLTVLGIGPVLAQNSMFLRRSPIAHMNQEDRQLLRETIDKLLESPDGTVLDWENPDTGSGGRVKVLDTEVVDGVTCRNVRARNQARGRQADGVYRLCQDENNTWRFAAAGRSAAPQPNPANEKPQ